MNGSAPNWPATGSQTSVRQKAKPNFWIERDDWRSSSKPIARDNDNEDERERARPHPETQILFFQRSDASLLARLKPCATTP